jgi:ribosomal protein S19E (S16A)
MQSVESKILTKINRTPRGALIFPEEFYLLGSSEAIRLALHRLEKKKEITRMAQGIYVRPKVSELIGEVLPSAEEVAEAIAKRDRIRTLPTGAYALNALGLSTQVPMKIVLLTDGSPRLIKVGKRTVKLKRTSPKNLLAKGSISRLVIQALKEIGNKKQTPEEEDKIIALLKTENRQHLMHDIPLAPVWIQKIMKKALN